MAFSLKSRERQIPNGFKYLQPETGWKSTPYASFSSIVNSLIAHRRGRPDLIAKHGWAIDYDGVAADVERFNVELCLRHGWNDYIQGGGDSPPPKWEPPPLAGRLGNVAAGAKVLVKWISGPAEAVEVVQSERRAQVCAACPHNQRGDWMSYFTEPVSAAIRKAIEQRKGYNLSTSLDSKLGVCEVCDCPLPLKVHIKIKDILVQLRPETEKSLPEHCWIKTEQT